ncbi:hypothetical protein [Streptomyces virginiae]
MPHRKKNRTQCCNDDIDQSYCDMVVKGGLAEFCCGCGRLYRALAKKASREENTTS